MNQIDALFVITVSLLAFIGLFFNLLLFYLIIFKSPDSLTPYRIFLANTTITQFVFAIFTLISQPRVLSVHSYTIVIYMGPIQFSGQWLSAMSYMGMVHLALNSFISIMLSMVYRYFSINDRRFTARSSILTCVLAYMLPLGSYLSCSGIQTSRDPTLNNDLIGNLVENLTQYNMVVATNIHNQPALLVFISLVSIGFIPIYAVMFWCRHKIYKRLSETSAIQSSTTKDNVKRLVHALTIQSLLPCFSIFPASIFYCLAQAGVVEAGVYSYFIVPCLLISCISDPIITMRCVLPYRRYIRRVCRLHSGEITVSNDHTRSDQYSRIANNVFSISYATHRVSLS